MPDFHAVPNVVGLSLLVAGSATLGAAAVGVPAGIVMAVHEFRFRRALVAVTYALLGVPPVVVGLLLFAVLSGGAAAGLPRLLYTPAAMVLAQFLLALPVVAALAHRAAAAHWRVYRAELLMSGAGLVRRIRTMLAVGRGAIAGAVLAAFGRTVSDVGAVLIVGADVPGATRTMTTAIVGDTGAGRFGEAALLAIAVLAVGMAAGAAAFALSASRGRVRGTGASGFTQQRRRA